MKHFFPDEYSDTFQSNVKLDKVALKNHIFSVRNIIYEVFSAASGYISKSTTLLEYWLLFHDFNNNINDKVKSSPKKVPRPITNQKSVDSNDDNKTTSNIDSKPTYKRYKKKRYNNNRRKELDNNEEVRWKKNENI